MPIHIHQSCCVARARDDDPQDKCFERPEHFESHEIEDLLDGTELDVTREQEVGRAIDRSADVELALGETKEIADCLWDTLKPYKDTDSLPPPYVACCRAAMGPGWKEKYGQLYATAKFNSTRVFDSIRVPGHQFEIQDQENEMPAYSIENSDPRINDGEINTAGEVLACGDAGICKSMWKLTDSEPEATVVVCAWQDERHKRRVLARVVGCVIYLYARLFNVSRYKASFHDIEVEEGTQVEEFLSSRPGVLMHEIAHDDDGLDAIDVVLKRQNIPLGFDRSKAVGYKETHGYKCYGSYLCEQLAESKQSDECITNAESWALLNVLFWLTRMKSKWHWTSGEAIRREGSVPEYLPYTKRQDRDKEIVMWLGKTS